MSRCLSLPLKQSSPSLTKRLLWVLPRKCVINPKLVVSDGMHYQVHRFVLNSHSPPTPGQWHPTLFWKIPWKEELGAGHCPWGRKELAQLSNFTFFTCDFIYSHNNSFFFPNAVLHSPASLSHR